VATLIVSEDMFVYNLSVACEDYRKVEDKDGVSQEHWTAAECGCVCSFASMLLSV